MTSESSSPIAHANGLVFLIALTLLVYANSFEGAFVFDDYSNIIESEKIRSLWPPTWFSGQRPWFYLSLALNYSAHELDPFGYHLFNFAVHLAAGLTLFGLVRRTLTLPNVAERYRDRADSIALVVAAIWLVHPHALSPPANTKRLATFAYPPHLQTDCDCMAINYDAISF